jgi:hypothetical protein
MRPDAVPAPPRAAARAAFAASFPDGLLMAMPKQGHGLTRDFKWLGSHRYGIVHLGGCDPADLEARGLQASALLGWPPATEAWHAQAANHPEPALAGAAATPAT